jgi:hypothetical protein
MANADYVEEDYTVFCCCGSRKRADEAAHIVGWVSLVLSVLSLNPISLVVSLCVVYAKERQKPGLYLPFLVVHVSYSFREMYIKLLLYNEVSMADLRASAQ